jgi:hypothetical protein
MFQGCAEPEEMIVVGDVVVDTDMAQLCKGETLQLTATVYPEDVAGKVDVEWFSSDESVATVSPDGLVTAIASGRAFVTAGAGNEFATVIVDVRVADSLAITEEYVTLEVGEDISLTLETVPATGVEGIVWSSSDESVATVTQDGAVSSVGKGIAVVRVSVDGLSDSCEVYVVGEPEVGDFYYSDGTYSGELFSKKDAIGVVFWVGDPTADDPTLRRDFPGCTHGLVVSLIEEASTWQSNYRSFNSTVGEWVSENAPEYMSPTTGVELEDNLNKIVGYNNTQAIKAFNSDYDNIGYKVDMVKRLQFFLGNKEFAAPEGTSGWYVPSAKELTLMIVGDMEGNINGLYTNDLPVRDILNESFSQLILADQFSPELYWCSSEYDAQNAFCVGFYNGLVAYNTKGAMNCMLRYVLAF